MRKFIKRYIAVFMAACVILGGWNVQEGTAQAATFSDINQDSVFLKQPGGSNLCTLVAATMMVRRGAMMNGNDNWASISTDMMRSAAWVEGIGLKWNFTCGSVTVAHDSFSGTAADLQTKLSEHPEGIVLYKQKSDQQHAILVTDYTDGVFYCADPSGAGCLRQDSAFFGEHYDRGIQLYLVYQQPDSLSDRLLRQPDSACRRDSKAYCHTEADCCSHSKADGDGESDSYGKA